MDWAYLFEISLTGLASGGLYALAALAFVMVYKATRVVNIAIGEILMVGAYLFFTFSASFALPLWLQSVQSFSALQTGALLAILVAGLWLVLTLDTTGMAIAAGVLVVITVYGELRSINSLIEGTPGLRYLDSIGRVRTSA